MFMTQVQDGIVQTAMQTTLVWLLLPIDWNKTDSFLCLTSSVVKEGIDKTVLCIIFVWLTPPIAWNKTDTSFIMSDMFCGQGWNRPDSPVNNTCLPTSANSLE